MTPADWPSLAPQIALAERLFGSRGTTLMGAWFDEQLERMTSPAFARLFSDHIDLPGISSGDYNHRLVRTTRGRLIGGIRFYGLDRARPFVEVVAHDFEDWDALRSCVAAEWAAFAPLHLRVLMATDAELPEGGHVDMAIFAARYGEMAPVDGRVRLSPFEDAEEAVAMVSARYDDLAEADPALARDISPAAAADIRHWHDQGRIKAISTAMDGTGEAIGLLAALPDAVEWIEGDVVNEEVVLTEFSGRGFAASAQKAWAARANVSPDRLLLGTIKSRNIASRRSAIRAGRRELLAYAFLPMRRAR